MERLHRPSGILTGIKLANFKCHKETPEIELAPLTLLVGPNSSGKSALIQPLLILKQTFDPLASSVAPIMLNGNYVDLGAFGDIIYGHELQKNLEVKVKIEVLTEFLRIPSRTRLILKKMKLNKIRIDYSFQVKYSEDQKKMILSDVSLSSEIFKFNLDPKRMILRAEIFGKKSKATERPLREQNLKGLMNAIPFWIRRPVVAEGMIREIDWATYFVIRRIMESITATIENIGYLGPVREYPLRYYLSTGEKVADVGISGETAIQVLHQDRISKGELTERLNIWLKKLGLAEGLIMKETIDPNLFSLEIMSPYTMTAANIINTGFGVSQILPAIVQSYLMPSNSTLILEQPEIHLHPKAQATLADLLISLTKQGKRFIVETHSEHIILRLQRRVAEGKIEPSQITIYYFDISKAGVTIRPIKIDSKGQLLDFPKGFMEEGLEEAYRMALASSAEE